MPGRRSGLLVRIGSTAFNLSGSKLSVAAGKTAQVKVKLPRKALRLLKHRKRITAKVKISVTRAGKTTSKTVKVTFKAPHRA